MNLQWTIAICLFFKAASSEVLQCCQGENILETRKCKEGSLDIVLSCQNRFLLKHDDVDNINELEGVLKYGITSVEKDSFCRTKINSSEVYIVCHNPEDVEEPVNFFVILGFISAAFLFLTIAIYLSIPKLLDLQGLCMVHSLLGLGCAFVLLGLNWFSNDRINFFCELLAYLLYFSFLYAFFWLNAYSFHLWQSTIQPKIFANVKNWKTIYYIYSCSCPLLLLVIVFFSQYSNIYFFTHPRMAEESRCWFGTIEATFVYLYGPISILLTLNVIFFFWTIYAMWKDIHKFAGKRRKILRYRLSLCVKMFFVMGISWIFEVLSAIFQGHHPSKLWIITDTINASQGVLIFYVMVVFRKRVYRLLAEKPCCKWLPATWKTIREEEYSESEDDDYKLDQVNNTGIVINQY